MIFSFSFLQLYLSVLQVEPEGNKKVSDPYMLGSVEFYSLSLEEGTNVFWEAKCMEAKFGTSYLPSILRATHVI